MKNNKINLLSILHYFILISLSLFLIIYYRQVAKNYYYGADEYMWIGRSYFLELYLKGDFKNQKWHSFFSFDQPKLGTYIIGAILYPQYLSSGKSSMIEYLETYGVIQHFDKAKTDYLWSEIQRSYDGYVKTTREELILTSTKLIDTVRLWNVFFLSASSIFVYLFARRMTNPWNGLLTMGIWGLHPVIVKSGIIVTGDIHYLFFMMPALFTISFIDFKKGKQYYLHILSGVLTALCAMSKLFGIFVPGYYILLFGVQARGNKKQFNKLQPWNLKGIFLYFISFIATLLIVDPYLWENPIKNFLFLFQFREQSAYYQQMYFITSALYNPLERLFSIFKNSVYLPLENYVRFASPVFTIFAIGIINLIVSGFILLWGGKRKPTRTFLIWSSVVLIIFLFILKLRWERYVSILILPLAFMVSGGVILFSYKLKKHYHLFYKSIEKLSKKYSNL